ncbi:hypothetical protein IQ255_12905 [Pleurocapsales cyanobacterium LEGE 10410]|nr:hypothetical protein [Pleurocapsales cyanobacterium LEGE 10410]
MNAVLVATSKSNGRLPIGVQIAGKRWQDLEQKSDRPKNCSRGRISISPNLVDISFLIKSKHLKI